MIAELLQNTIVHWEKRLNKTKTRKFMPKRASTEYETKAKVFPERTGDFLKPVVD